MFIDTHCHLDFADFKKDPFTLNQLLQNMQKHKVAKAITISVALEDWENVHKIARENDNIYCSVGIHPDYENIREAETDELVRLAKLEKVVAIGECGLDYYQHPSKPKWQEVRFGTHIEAARLAKKPLVIHSRDSGARMIEMLKSEKASEAGGVMHCFTDTWDIAKAAIDLGFYISFSGIVSFKNAKQIHDVARKMPADRYLIETDSPFLAPTPHRGKTNQPAFVSHVAQAMADIRNCPIEQIAKESSDNANLLFNLN